MINSNDISDCDGNYRLCEKVNSTIFDTKNPIKIEINKSNNLLGNILLISNNY